MNLDNLKILNMTEFDAVLKFCRPIGPTCLPYYNTVEVTKDYTLIGMFTLFYKDEFIDKNWIIRDDHNPNILLYMKLNLDPKTGKWRA
jgi:hypothetical protein